MKGKTVLTTALIVCLSLTTITAGFVHFAKAFTPTPLISLSPLPDVYVDPSTVNVEPGELFNVSVCVNSTSTSPPLNLTGWQVGLQWDVNIINITGSFYTNLTYFPAGLGFNKTDSSNPQQTYELWFAIASGMTASSAVQINSTNSPFTLMTVTFAGMRAGISCIDLIDVLLIYPSATSMTTYDRPSDITLNGRVVLQDISAVAKACAQFLTSSSPVWNPSCDIDDNNVVNIIDLQIVRDDYGKSWGTTPPTTPLPTNTVFAYEMNVQNGSAAVGWWMFHHDLSHTGYSASTAPGTNQPLWNYTTSAKVDSSPAVVGYVVYVGSADDNVYALDAATGLKIWNYTTGGNVGTSPAVANGIVYVGSQDDNVYALNALTGAMVWNYTTGGPVESSPAVANGLVYVGSNDDNLYALNAANGSLVWEYPTGDFVESSPAVAGGTVYVGDHNGNIYALNATTGALMPGWPYPTGGPVPSSPAVANGIVYVGSDDWDVYALNATTGALMPGWPYPTGGSVPCSPAVAGGMVYVGSMDGNVYALDATTGNEIWRFTTAGPVGFSSPAVAGGTVFIGSTDNNVYALNAANGSLVWVYSTGGLLGSSPAVAYGDVFVGSEDGNVYAIGPPPQPSYAMKTLYTANNVAPGNGYFYVCQAVQPVPTYIKIEMLFNNPHLVGDQRGGKSPYLTVASWPDGTVNMMDIGFVARHFGALQGGSNWDFMADLVPDQGIDMKDVGFAASNFPRTGTYMPWPQSNVTVSFDGGAPLTPNVAGFVPIPLGATNFTVYQNSAPIGALVTFWP